jgi:arginine/lysine/ornithine decarboxylase
VQSLHKADGGLCQASVMLVGGKQVNPVDLRLRLDFITTTSPSALMYGSIDGFRRRMVAECPRLLDMAPERAARLRERLARVPGLTVMDDSVVGHDSVAEWDPLKLGVDVSAPDRRSRRRQRRSASSMQSAMNGMTAQASASSSSRPRRPSSTRQILSPSTAYASRKGTHWQLTIRSDK